MSKTVYFVRHGECVANTKGIIAGLGDDSPLTELGIKADLIHKPEFSEKDVGEFTGKPKEEYFAFASIWRRSW